MAFLKDEMNTAHISEKMPLNSMSKKQDLEKITAYQRKMSINYHHFKGTLVNLGSFCLKSTVATTHEKL